MALDRESDNSDDANLRRQVGMAGDRLKSAIAAFVQASKAVVSAPGDAAPASAWRAAASSLLAVVTDVATLFDDLNMYGMDSARDRMRQAQPPQKPVNIVVTPPPAPPETVAPPPPRPPLPQEARVPGRPPMPTIGGGHDTDDEEGLFSGEPGTNRPIRAAAQGLYQEVSKVQKFPSFFCYIQLRVLFI